MLEIRQRHDPLQIFKYAIPAFEPLEWLNKSDHWSLCWLACNLIMILVIAINLPLQYAFKAELPHALSVVQCNWSDQVFLLCWFLGDASRTWLLEPCLSLLYREGAPDWDCYLKNGPLAQQRKALSGNSFTPGLQAWSNWECPCQECIFRRRQ